MWARDTSGALLVVTEMHFATKKNYSDNQYRWITQMDYYAEKNAYAHPELKAFSDKNLDAAKTKPHYGSGSVEQQLVVVVV